MRTIEEIRKELENRQVRSAWDKGVTEYALDLLDNLKEYRDYDHRDHKVDAAAVEKEMLNGASDWKQYSSAASPQKKAVMYHERKKRV